MAEAVSQERIEATLAELVGERWTADQRAAAREIISGELEDTGYEVEERPFGDGGVNVVARLDGSDPDAAAVLVGAHYDTVKASPGADDNGTGVAAVLEIARVLADTQPIAPVELVLFDLEEPGRLGSTSHAMEATESGRSSRLSSCST